jgi:hypothetical protein
MRAAASWEPSTAPRKSGAENPSPSGRGTAFPSGPSLRAEGRRG